MELRGAEAPAVDWLRTVSNRVEYVGTKNSLVDGASTCGPLASLSRKSYARRA